MADIHEFNGVTRLDLPVERVLGMASEANLETCVVIGFNEDGELYFASTTADGGNVIWLLESAKLELLTIE